MDWKEIAGTVGKIAGTVAPLLGGPVGMAASIGAQIAGAIGADNSPEAVKAKLESDPEAMLKLEQWAQQEREQIRQFNIRLNEIELEREKSALANIEHAREQHKDDTTPRQLTIALFMAVCALGSALFLVEIPEKSRDLAVYFTGQIVSFFGVTITFWFGSSLGSKLKTKIGSILK